MDLFVSKIHNDDLAYEYLHAMYNHCLELNEKEQFEFVLKTISDIAQKDFILPVPLETSKQPKIEPGILKIASDYLNKNISVYEGEIITKEDETGVLAKSFGEFSRGTAFIKRHTNFAEFYWFIRCFRNLNGELFRTPQPDKLLEDKLSEFKSIRVFSPEVRSEFKNRYAQPEAVLGTVASTIALSLIGMAADKIGGMALDYVLNVLKITPADENEKDYNELIRIIKFEFRQKFVNDMRKLLNSVVEALNNHNNGTPNSLMTAYNWVIKLVGQFLEEEKGMDTTIIRANALALHLSILQEIALDAGGRGRYTGYQSVVSSGKTHHISLKNMRDASSAHRLSMISNVKSNRVTRNPDFYSVWYDDDFDESLGEERRVSHIHLSAALEEMWASMRRHRQKVIDGLNKSFYNVDIAFLGFEQLSLGLIKGGKISVANEQNVWMTLHGMVFNYSDDMWNHVLIDLRREGHPLNIWIEEISVGTDGTVLAQFRKLKPSRGALNSICELQGDNWKVISNDCISLCVGDSENVWKVSHTNEVFRRDHNSGDWNKIEGSLKKISVSNDGTVWGLGVDNNALRYNAANRSWDDLGGKFSGIAVGSKTVIWAFDEKGVVSQYTNNDEVPWKKMDFKKISNLAVGTEGIPWFVDEFGRIFKCSQWELIEKASPTLDVTIYSDPHGHTYCLDDDGTIQQYIRSSRSFKEVKGPPTGLLKSLSVGLANNMCGIQAKSNGIPWIRRLGTWENGGDSAISLAYGRTTWGLFWGDGFVNYWDQGWQHLTGEAARQITASSDGAVWVLKSIPGIPHVLEGRNFKPVASKKFVMINCGSRQHICGIDGRGKIYKYTGDTQNPWQLIGLGFKNVAVGDSGNMYAIDMKNRLLRYDSTRFFEPSELERPFSDVNSGKNYRNTRNSHIAPG